jgi:tetratricopeptide (TPR) repeat protein
MSPEQQTSGAPLPPASDIYALGLILFEILTGRVYAQQEPGTLPGALLPDLPAQVDHVLGRMLAPDPRERFWNGAQAAQTLRHTLEQLRHYTPAPTAEGAQPLPAAPTSGRFAHAFAEARAPMTFRAPVKLRSGDTVENGWDLLQAMRDNPAEAETQLYSGNFALALRESLHPEVLAALAALQQRDADRARVTQRFMERLLPALLEEGQAQTANALSARDWPRAEFLTRKLLALEPELAMAQHFRQQALRGAVQDAQTAWQAGEVTQALTYARQALTIAPEDESAAYLADMAGRIVAIEEAVAGHLQAGTPWEAWALLDEVRFFNPDWDRLMYYQQEVMTLWTNMYNESEKHNAKVRTLPNKIIGLLHRNPAYFVGVVIRFIILSWSGYMLLRDAKVSQFEGIMLVIAEGFLGILKIFALLGWIQVIIELVLLGLGYYWEQRFLVIRNPRDNKFSKNFLPEVPKLPNI